MDRRDVLSLGGLAALGAAMPLFGGAGAQPATAEGPAQIIRVYADENGDSRLEVVNVVPGGDAIPLTDMTVNKYEPGTNDWHTAPARLFAINMIGTLEVETSTGTKRRIGPGELVFLEDTTGKGHITRIVDPITFLFINVPQDFDLETWAKAQNER